MLHTYTLNKVPDTNGYELYFIRTKDQAIIGSIVGVDGKYQVVFDTYFPQNVYTSNALLSNLEEAKKYFIESRIKYIKESICYFDLMFKRVNVDQDIEIELL